MDINISIAVIGGLVLYAFLRVLLHITQDAREPQAIDTLVPFMSPIMNMIMRGSTYFKSRSSVPIYTLRLPGARLYIVNSTALIPFVQRKAPTISFTPILIKVAAGIMAFSKTGMDIVGRDPTGKHSLLEESAKNNHFSLTPGPRLHELNKRAMRLISKSLGDLHGVTSPPVLKLHEWISRTIIMTSTETMYGPRNPFRDPGTIQIWQEFGTGFVPLIVNFLPQLFDRKPVRAREALVKCFESYYENGGYENPEVSSLIRNRYGIFHERGLSTKDIARHEVGSSLALLINTIPATFWFVYHLFSDPVLLEICRRELSGGVVVGDDGTRSVDLAFIKTACPTFLSAFKETLRFHGINVAARVVLEDTLVNNQFLLKKGGILLIPGAVQHGLESVWGHDASDFNYLRFIRVQADQKKRHNPAAFRVFGGGSVVCPGRYFATTEILGRWTTPTVYHSNPGISFQQPDHDVEVEIRPRDEWKWKISVLQPEETVGASTLGDLNVTDA
ncbi:cytochrome P450 [Xylaria sp. FL0064]|nr:cytochrome P450 [Xylaria sp. FL0064]